MKKKKIIALIALIIGFITLLSILVANHSINKNK